MFAPENRYNALERNCIEPASYEGKSRLGKSSTRRNVSSPSYCHPSCSDSDVSPEPTRRRNQGAHQDRELTRDELIRLMEECEADPSSPTPSDSEGENFESDDEESSGSEFEDPTPKKNKASPKKKSSAKRQRQRSPIIKRTKHQIAVGKKTLLGIFKETENPSLEMRAKIAEVLKMNKSLVTRFFRRERKKSEIPERVKRISPEMRMKLEAEFETNPNPTTERKTELATEFNVLHERVTAWFIRRRQKQYKPEEFAAAQEKRRIYKNERDHQMRIQQNRQPAFRFTEEQRNFMNEKMKEVEGKEAAVEQCRKWGDEINLTSYQVSHYIRKHLRRQREPSYETRIRHDKKRRVKEGLEEHKKIPRPAGPPLSADEALLIIKNFLVANPNYRQEEDGSLAQILNWSKSKLKHFLRDKGLVGRRKVQERRKAQVGNAGFESKFEQKPFVSKADAEEWAKQLIMTPNTILSLAHKLRERLLKKYLSGEKTLDSLPPQMKMLEEEYSKNVFIESVAAAIEIKEYVGIELVSVNGYFSMRRRLDRERGLNLIKEEDVPKILSKDVLKFKKRQKNASAAVESEESDHEDPDDLENGDFDEDCEMEETSRPQSPENVHQDFEVSRNGNFDEEDDMEETSRPQSSEEGQHQGNDDVFYYDDFDTPQNLETPERGITEEDGSEHDDDVSKVDSEAGMYDSDWEYEDLLAGENEDPDNNLDVDVIAGANILMEPKEEDQSGAEMLQEPEDERM
ncbi:hypothetical protein CRE_20881 [Caenorhabditis remanei]|uniref:Homeobox domain-containing protein n=1 Tax=Caenorhabditis remanei TaxID=31234 RepID=E3MV34_CAERE|nr:hypothetical protein CRE_20881 [Caenorhabditis remanei]